MSLRLWPRSLIGQMLAAVAVALLLVQGFGALLVYQAQAERRQAALIHGAAFRLMGEIGGVELLPRAIRRHAGPGRDHGFRVEHSQAFSVRDGEVRDTLAENQIRAILDEQDIEPADVIVLRRPIADDPAARERALRRAAFQGEPHDKADGDVMIAALRMDVGAPWLVTRAELPWRNRDLILPLLWQTLLIYCVVVAVVALVLSRITRPLALLTRRLERFAETRNPNGQIAPEGPDDVRRLIVAHNAMEARISALLDEKDVMLGAIGHDLKTPLAALRVRIESVEDDGERLRMAGTIEDIVRTLDDILSLARVGRASDPLEQSELSALVASIVEEYEDMGEPVTLADTQRIALPLRATWIRRGLRNLIGNAIRYGRAARVSLSREGDSALVTIEDDGPGIPEAAIAAMLEPFARGDPSRNSETGGSGLGLTLARAIAEQHGGSLELANRTVSDGTICGLRATLRLPLSPT